MDLTTLIIIFSLGCGFYTAWNIGANDVANAVGTSVGSKALTLKQAVILAAIFEFCGAFFFGGHVTSTLQKGIISPTLFSNEPTLFMLGMLAALLGTGIWLQVASFFGWPVSTTHAIVGAILGFAVLSGFGAHIQWYYVGFIATSWVISPILSGIISYFTFSFIQKTILFSVRPAETAKKIIPYFVWIVICILMLAIIGTGLRQWAHFPWIYSWILAVLIASIGTLASRVIMAKIAPTSCQIALTTHSKYLPENTAFLSKAVKHLQRVSISSEGKFHDEIQTALRQVEKLKVRAQEELHRESDITTYPTVERLFMLLQILSACFIAFSHGANDVANAVGPLAAIFSVIKNGITDSFGSTPWYILGFGGVGIVVGLATWGWRVIETIGKKITVLTPTRGFCAEFGTAATILLASRFGMPVSTTHSLVGAILGVGFARGLSALNLKVLRDIALSWIITIPVSAILSMSVYLALKYLFY